LQGIAPGTPQSTEPSSIPHHGCHAPATFSAASVLPQPNRHHHRVPGEISLLIDHPSIWFPFCIAPPTSVVFFHRRTSPPPAALQRPPVRATTSILSAPPRRTSDGHRRFLEPSQTPARATPATGGHRPRTASSTLRACRHGSPRWCHITAWALSVSL
jgi:hypothetical protein